MANPAFSPASCVCCGGKKSVTSSFYCAICYYFSVRFFPSESHSKIETSSEIQKIIDDCVLEIERLALEGNLDGDSAFFFVLRNALEKIIPIPEQIPEIPPHTIARMLECEDWGAENLFQNPPLDLGENGTIEWSEGTKNGCFLYFVPGNGESCLLLFISPYRLKKLLFRCIDFDCDIPRPIVPILSLLPQVAIWGSRSRLGCHNVETPWYKLGDCCLRSREDGGNWKKHLPINDLAILRKYQFPAYEYFFDKLETGLKNYLDAIDAIFGWTIGLTLGLFFDAKSRGWDLAELCFVHQPPDDDEKWIEGRIIPWSLSPVDLWLITGAAICPIDSPPFLILRGVCDGAREHDMREAMKRNTPLQKSFQFFSECCKVVDAEFVDHPRKGILVKGTSGAHYLIHQGHRPDLILVLGISAATLERRAPQDVHLSEWRPLCVRSGEDDLEIGDQLASLVLGLRSDETASHHIHDIALITSDFAEIMSDEEQVDFQNANQ